MSVWLIYMPVRLMACLTCDSRRDWIGLLRDRCQPARYGLTQRAPASRALILWCARHGHLLGVGSPLVSWSRRVANVAVVQRRSMFLPGEIQSLCAPLWRFVRQVFLVGLSFSAQPLLWCFLSLPQSVVCRIKRRGRSNSRKSAIKARQLLAVISQPLF
jgi:hypothetical protein